MGLTADEKDVTIAKLAISLTVTDGRLDDALAEVSKLQTKIKELEAQLAKPAKNGAHVG